MRLACIAANAQLALYGSSGYNKRTGSLHRAQLALYGSSGYNKRTGFLHRVKYKVKWAASKRQSKHGAGNCFDMSAECGPALFPQQLFSL